MKTCFACHEKAKVSDLVFTHYAPEAENVYLADPPYTQAISPAKHEAQAAVLSLVFSSDTSESLGATTQEAAAM
jgi:hypothetical protein